MRGVYSLLIRLAAPIAFGYVLLRGFRDRSYWQGVGERFGFGPALGLSGGVWLHAVSLGEVAAAAALVRALQSRYPQMPLAVTAATPTGRARARALFGAAVDVRFLPYDSPGAVARFLRRVRPRLAIVMETELWPNLYHACAARGIPLLLASARISAKSVSRYRRFGALFGGALARHAVIAAQTAEDAERFRSLGADADRCHVIGNVKFDIEVGPEVLEQGRTLRAQFGGTRGAWIAGSTHEGEEELVLDAQAEVLSRLPDALLILVPRHPQRFEGVAALLARRGWRYARRSAGAPVRADTQVLLVDTVGELLAFYASADVAFVGGSLVPVGGHNLLEPAALGLPVLCGPSHFNGAQVAQLLLSEAAAQSVADAQELAAAVILLLGDPAQQQLAGARARRAVLDHRGSTRRLLELIEPLLEAAGASGASVGATGSRPAPRHP
jgi:3-deoxy-D-manno-octulosonic-acid transferase